MKKLIALLLVLALLTMLVACNTIDNPTPPDDGLEETQETEQKGTIQYPLDPMLTDDIPDFVDYNKTEVKILIRGERAWELGLTEGTDVLSAALYERTKRTEARLNVDLKIDEAENWESYSAAIAKIRNSISNQKSAWDIVTGWSSQLPIIVGDGLCYNLNQLEYFNSYNIWWSQSLAKELTVNGRMFLATGDISTDYMRGAHCIFFNQKLAKEEIGMDYEAFYEKVSTGKWTFDELYFLSKNGYKDLNGNKNADMGDQFGLLMISTRLQELYGAAGISLIKNNGVDRPAFDDERIDALSDIWSKIETILSVKATVYSEFAAFIDIKETFAQGKGIFLLHELGGLENISNMTDSFGILPMPKYNEKQDNYYTQVQSCELWSVPSDAKNVEMSAAIMTSLGYDSYNVVIEPHFEKLLKMDYDKNSEAGYMIDTIYYNSYMNFDSIYNQILPKGIQFVQTSKKQMPMFVFGLLANKDYDSVSAWWNANGYDMTTELEFILQGYYS